MSEEHIPNLDAQLVDLPTLDKLGGPLTVKHKPRILLLYGSTRERSFSRLLTEEAARLLEHFGAETRIFNPSGLPLPDDAPDSHTKVQELRAEGEALHKAGDHAESVKVLGEALDLLAASE